MRAIALAVLLASSPADRWTSPDKAFHAVVGFSIGAGVHALSSAYLPRANPFLVSSSAGLVLGGGKELFDLVTGRGTPSWRDFTVTVLGDFAGQLFSWAVQSMFRVVDVRLR